ncbi:MAG: DNA/RNA non-specific endonuclease [Solobacterium sp.]|nr:DNA/RNA non-specific endonuclease [Solobacterium sp.]
MKIIIGSFCSLLLLSIILSHDFIIPQSVVIVLQDPTSTTKTDNTLESDSIIDNYDIESFVDHIPEYTDESYITLNDDKPLFTDWEKQEIKGIHYSSLDDLGRCGPAIGLISLETLPKEERGPIGEVKPSGWHTVRYDSLIEDRYLYNRCHLIGYQLAGANAEPRNLITGTRYLNIVSMLPLENAVLGYILATGNHVLYRSTPIFEGDDLIASGVFLEAYSVEDEGEGICFFKYLYNIQPGVIIDYRTGDSQIDSSYNTQAPEKTEPLLIMITDQEQDISDRSLIITENINNLEITYAINTNTLRFHDLSCPSVEETKKKNLAYSINTREELIEQGYEPCGRCNP